ncbi:MAG: beta-ketoacyl-ACP synthase II [Solirubrobacterales bacterium]
MSRGVVITGVGAVTPLGVGAETTHERWCEGRSGISDGLGRADEFEPRDHLTVKQVRRADRATQLALTAAAEATSQAGWEEGLPCDSERIGCIVGTGIGGMNTIESEHDVLRERGPERISALAVPLMMANAPAGMTSMRYGLHGPSFGTVSACASGAHALGTAVRTISWGDADACLAGGTESALTELAAAAFAKMEATSPTGISRPFDRLRDGFVMGEAAGVLALEAEEVAEARGAPVIGRVRGYAATSDAHHITAPEPSGRGARRAMELALEDAGLGPADLDYVNAHGTSTQLNDRSETEALKAALGEDARRLPISSLKSSVGHLLGAAGAVEAVATALALRDRIAPPTINYENPDEGLDLDYVPNVSRPMFSDGDGKGRPVIGMSNSFGFGGHNAVLVLEVD